MQYLSNADNNPEQTVSYWLARHDAEGVSGFWLASGFFSLDGIEYFRPAVESAKARSGEIRIVVGSNRGSTLGAAVSELLDTLDAADNATIGVVQYSNAFFHPKAVVLELPSGMREAYVGSANATAAGLGGLHVEAGLALDESAGDGSAVIDAIQASISRWFHDTPPGFHLVRDHDDVLALEELGVLGLPPVNVTPSEPRDPSSRSLGARRRLLRPATTEAATDSGRLVPVELPEYADTVTAPVGKPPADLSWSKTISASDAQRKAKGNQRGAITLVKSGHAIDPLTWFREELFGHLEWTLGQTRTGEPREEALAQAEVKILGQSVGARVLRVSHAPNREEGQHNYVSLLHLDGLSAEFAKTNYTGRSIKIDLLDSGSYYLEIA